MTGINRRKFSLLIAGAALSPGLLQAANNPPLLLSAAQDQQGKNHLIMLDQTGGVLLKHRLPGRAHHVALHPDKPWAAAIARRPERFIDLVNYKTGQLIQRIIAEQAYHFYGHAIFSPDGRFLISSENRLTDGQGVIVVRDLTQQAIVVAIHRSYGTGPHELALMPDGTTLVVANGGIKTHPNKGRKKLNLDSMQPSLVYMNWQTGLLIEQQFMPGALHQLSMRHLAINQQGTAMIALQYQGPLYDDVPLVAVHRQGQALKLLRAPEQVNAAMKQYCGSVRFDQSGNFAAISSPRGNLVTFWDLRADQFVTQCTIRDACGLAATPQAGEFMISNGSGRLYRFDLNHMQKQRLPLSLTGPMAWDNHMSPV
ncbi:MAG: DUF1513 domain-containing protein [Pontibacterium sp.]